MSKSLSCLHPEVHYRASLMLQILSLLNVSARVTSTCRSSAEQARLYALRQSRPDIQPYPVARPGTSYHEYGRAFDLSFPSQEHLSYAVIVARYLGFRWSPTDPVHFEI